MDCRQAASAVFSPEGTELLRQVGADSALVCLDLPLDSQGRLHPGRHDGPPVAWQGENRRACYLNLSGIKDLTSYLSLPPPGKLMLSCHCPAPGTDMDTVLAGMEQGTARLAILPARAYSDAELDRLRLRCAATGRKAVLIQVMTATARACFFDGGKEPGTWDWETFTSGEAPFPSLDCGPARVRLLPRDALLHPEMVLACAKEGADLVIVFSDSFGEEERLLAGTRTIEQAAVALCSPQGAGIFMPPEAHQPWTQALTGPDGHCQAELDTGKTRKKRFQDRIDYKTLMARVYLN